MSYLPFKPQNVLVDRTVATWLLLQASTPSKGSAQGSLHTYSFDCEKSYLLPSCHLSIQIMLEDTCLQRRSCPCWVIIDQGIWWRGRGFASILAPVWLQSIIATVTVAHLSTGFEKLFHSHCILTWLKKSKLVLWPVLIEALIPFVRTPPLWPLHLLKTLLPKTITQEVRVQIWKGAVPATWFVRFRAKWKCGSLYKNY